MKDIRTITEIEKRIAEVKEDISLLEQKKREILESSYTYKKEFYVPFVVWDNMEFPETTKIVIHTYDEYDVHATVYYNERQFELHEYNDKEIRVLYVAPTFQQVEEKLQEMGEQYLPESFEIYEKILG